MLAGDDIDNGDAGLALGFAGRDRHRMDDELREACEQAWWELPHREAIEVCGLAAARVGAPRLPPGNPALLSRNAVRAATQQLVDDLQDRVDELSPPLLIPPEQLLERLDDLFDDFDARNDGQAIGCDRGCP